MHVLTQVLNSPQVSSCEAPQITQANLRRVLDYDPDTGIFTWKQSRGHKAIRGSRAGSISRNKGKKVRYRSIGVFGKKIREHRLAFLWMTGAFPDELVDHVDGDGTNNAWSNLREASYTQNNWNSSASSRNLSGLKGVAKRENGKFCAQINVAGKNIYLGYFNSAEAANAAYRDAANIHHGEFARAK